MRYLISDETYETVDQLKEAIQRECLEFRTEICNDKITGLELDILLEAQDDHTFELSIRLPHEDMYVGWNSLGYFGVIGAAAYIMDIGRALSSGNYELEMESARTKSGTQLQIRKLTIPNTVIEIVLDDLTELQTEQRALPGEVGQ